MSAPLFLAAVFCSTFEKVHWNVAGTVYLADVTTLVFLAVWALDRAGHHGRRVPRTAGVLLVFLVGFLLVYLIGFFNLDTQQAAAQFGKGIAKWLIHFVFLIVAVIYLAGHSRAFYWRTLAWFFAGITFNAVYGILQLGAAQAGHNLDSFFIKPLTRGASQINVYGAVGGSNVYRPNALTGDPNHLGIMLLVPLLVALADLPAARAAPSAAAAARVPDRAAPARRAGDAVAQRAARARRRRARAGRAVPASALDARRRAAARSSSRCPCVFELYRRFSYFETVIRSRFETSGKGTTAHFGVYSFIPDVLHLHPLFGLGYNNFSVYYEFVTGKTNWGPHSYYVALLVEGGLVGTLLFAGFLLYVLHRLGVARRIGRSLAAAGNPEAARVRPLAWGMTAALLGTMAANAFYLTLSFFYFFVFAALALATPIVFGRQDTSSSELRAEVVHRRRARASGRRRRTSSAPSCA